MRNCWKREEADEKEVQWLSALRTSWACETEEAWTQVVLAVEVVDVHLRRLHCWSRANVEKEGMPRAAKDVKPSQVTGTQISVDTASTRAEMVEVERRIVVAQPEPYTVAESPEPRTGYAWARDLETVLDTSFGVHERRLVVADAKRVYGNRARPGQ
jgi:hypothetical protein